MDWISLVRPGTPEALAMGCTCTQKNWGEVITDGWLTDGCPIHSRDGVEARALRADELTRKWTGWKSFEAMVRSVDDPAYFPSLAPPRGRSKAAKLEAAALAELADLYDQAQRARGDARRAYRGRTLSPSTLPE